jgi:hypothetical protein
MGEQDVEEAENFKKEVANLDPTDRRWLAAGGAIVLAILLFALLTGSVLGDALAFVLAFAAGWIAHTEWQTITRRRHQGRTPRGLGGPGAQPSA